LDFIAIYNPARDESSWFTGSLVHFKNENVFFYFVKMLLPTTTLEVVGFAPNVVFYLGICYISMYVDWCDYFHA
jgi:hypothetical protein